MQRIIDLAKEALRGQFTLREFRRSVERPFIIEALAENKNNNCRTADRIGMHRNTLIRVRHDYNITREEVQSAIRRNLLPKKSPAAVQPQEGRSVTA